MFIERYFSIDVTSQTRKRKEIKMHNKVVLEISMGSPSVCNKKEQSNKVKSLTKCLKL